MVETQAVKQLLNVNKCESTTLGISLASEFWNSIKESQSVSAIHGSGTGDLLDLVIGELPESNIQDEEKIMMSIIGRPNVGKLVENAISGEKRAIVSDISEQRLIPQIPINKGGHLWKIVDTAGLAEEMLNMALNSLELLELLNLLIEAMFVF